MPRGKTNKADIDFYLQHLEQDIEEFLRNSIELGVDVEAWSNLHDTFKPLRCWEIKGCSQTKCLAYNHEDYRCWLQVGTLCCGEVQGEFARKYKTCLGCEVFQQISKEPFRPLYEKINIVIAHLQSVALRSHELAIKDPLTGLYNRHFFNEIIEREIAGSSRRYENLSFIMIDMDDFKKINDNHGHLTGDKILVEAAGLIRKTVRKSDLVFRFGGDEFLVLMLNAGCDKKTHMVQRLLKEIDSWNNAYEGVYGCTLSFSMGCSTCSKACDVHAALNEADEMMYRDKYRKKDTEKK